MKPPIKTGCTSRGFFVDPPDPNASQSSFATYLGSGWTTGTILRRRRYRLCLARRLWVMGGISIVFEHLRDDGTSD